MIYYTSLFKKIVFPSSIYLIGCTINLSDYCILFFQDIDDCIINAYVLSIIVGLIRMFVGFITSQLLFKYGRRILCLTSLMSMTVLMFISGSFILFIQRGMLKMYFFILHKYSNSNIYN